MTCGQRPADGRGPGGLAAPALALSLCLKALAACAGPAPRAGTVSGVLVSQQAAGHSAGGEAAINTAGHGQVELLSGGRVATEFATRPDGSFRAPVPAGRYQVRGLEGRQGRCAAEPGSVIVRPGRVTGLLVYVLCRKGRRAGPAVAADHGSRRTGIMG